MAPTEEGSRLAGLARLALLEDHQDGRAPGHGRPIGATATEREQVRVPDGPVWFGSEHAPLFGWVHRPAEGGRSAVVLCPPLFGEQTSARRAYRTLATNLAAAGMAAVRFDYEGTGDSASSSDAPGLVARWLHDVRAGVALARTCVDGPVALVGMRMGATLAALAVEAGVDVDALVLWDPCLSGRTFLRRLQSLHALRFGAPASETGLVELPGVELRPDTATDLARLRLPHLSPDRRTLVLVRPGDPGLATAPTAGGEGSRIELVTLEAGEQESLLEVLPVEARLPVGGLTRVQDWLSHVLSDPVEAAPTSRSPAPDVSGAPMLRTGDQPATLDVEVDGTRRRVQERCLRIGPLGLFAIETRPAPSGAEPIEDGQAARRAVPAAGQAGGSGPVAVFLSTGGGSHVGPARFWVSLARRWAALGVRCVRMDESGLGESGAREGQLPQVVRHPEAFDDVADVVAAVAGDPRRSVLVGLCSGGYQALESALELSPLGVLTVNPGMWFTPPEVIAGGLVSDRRRIHLHQPGWWSSVPLPLPNWARLVVRRVVRWWHWRRPGGARGVRGTWQAELVRQGVQVFCLVGADEEHGVTAGDVERADRRDGAAGAFDIEVVEGLDHAVGSLADRQLVTDRLTRRLLEILGREGTGSAV